MPDGAIFIAHHNDPGIERQMQKPQHMTGAQRVDQQILWIMQLRIPTQERIIRAFDDRFARAAHLPAPIIAVVTCIALAPIAGPTDLRCKVMHSRYRS